MKHGLKSLGVLLSLTLFSGIALAEQKSILTDGIDRVEPTLEPIPTPQGSVDAIPAEPQVAAQVPTPAQSQEVAQCTSPVDAKKYTVTGLFKCGERVRNSRLAGVWNRRAAACTEEAVIATVYASPETCESCGARAAARQIRLGRGGAACENPGYITCLVQDLASVSNRIRHAAKNALRDCGFRVLESKACVEQELPVVVIY